jgi:hypothetical protein
MDSISAIFKNFQREDIKNNDAHYHFQARVVEIITDLKIKKYMQPAIFKSYHKDKSKVEAAYQQVSERKDLKNKAGYFIWLVNH